MINNLNKKRLMIVGASILQLPAIHKAKEMGLHVGVADYNPEAIGISYADEYFNVSTIDEKGVYEATKAFQADGIMTLATDMPMRSIAYTCEKLGLNGIDYSTAVRATDKAEMIKAFECAGVSRPWYYVIDNIEYFDFQRISYPCITKPTDNSGSRGVFLVKDKDKLAEALQYSSAGGRSGRVIIEEFMQGPEVSVEVMVIAGEPHILQITDKLTTGTPHFVEMGHSQPSRLPQSTQEQITDLASRAVRAVGIENSPAHVEIIVTADGPKMVELGARMGGDCITSHLVPLSTGIDMVKGSIMLALGERPEYSKKFSKGAAIRYFDVPCGRIQEIFGVEEAKKSEGICEIFFTKKVGDYCGEVQSSIDRVGYVIAQSNTIYGALEYCNKAIQTVRIIMG